MRGRISAILVLALCAGALGQTRPTTTPAATRTAPASSVPKNLERTLQDLITIDAAGVRVEDFVESLRKITQTNIAVNWNSLAAAGITRDVPVTLHLKDVPYEAAVRTLMELLPAAKGGGANYTVGDNILEITSNFELGKGAVPRLLGVERAIGYSMNGSPDADERVKNSSLVEQILLVEMRRGGEPMDAKGHSLGIKDGMLAANVSDRGLGVLNHAIADFAQPVKVGQIAGGTQLTAPAKRTIEAMKDAEIVKAGNLGIAREPEKYKAKISTALLPGTTEELAKEKPDIDLAITDGGVVLLGPREALRARTLMAVYDLRDNIRKLAARNQLKPAPNATEYQAAIVQIIEGNIKPGGDGKWITLDDLAKNPAGSCLIPYNGVLVVFATAQTHRTIAGALQEIGK